MTSTEIQLDTVVKAINEVLGMKRSNWEPVRPDTRFDQLELDSLDIVEVFATLEDWLGTELDPDSVGEVETVADLAALRAL
ncbi:MAG: acyl carrier protein [Solirubrobacterales bacterium]